MTQQALQAMIQYYGSDIRRINHALKVYGFAQHIARMEELDDHTVLVTDLAAIMHDIGIPEAERKYGSSAGKYQEIEGPPVARKMLDELSFSNNVIDRVCFLVGNHHSYSKIDGMDFQILIEADFLVNIDEDEIQREQVETLRSKYFKTKSGTRILDAMYLKKV